MGFFKDNATGGDMTLKGHSRAVTPWSRLVTMQYVCTVERQFFMLQA